MHAYVRIPRHQQIASACIQAHRVAKKVIVAKGNNDFLVGNGEGIHVGVRKDFRPTENGMVRTDGKIVAPPPPADPTNHGQLVLRCF